MLVSAGFVKKRCEKFAGNWRTPWSPSGKAKQKITSYTNTVSLTVFLYEVIFVSPCHLAASEFTNFLRLFT